MTAVALLPVVVSVCTTAFRTTNLLGDYALFDLRVRDVWSAHIPLLGPYSRYGWNHPGPIVYYLVAPFTWLMGHAPWATVVGGTLLQGVAIALVARLAWRRGGLPLLLGALVAVLTPYLALGPVAIISPWNPFIPMPFFVLFVLEVWAVTTGDSWQVVWAAVVGTFLVQTHIGYLPFVAVGVLFGAVFLLVDRWRDGRAVTSLRRPLVWAAVALGVLWLPPMIDEVAGRHNIDRIVDYFTTPHHPSGPSFDVAARDVADAFRGVGYWFFGGASPARDALGLPLVTPAPWVWVVLVVALLVVGAVAAYKTGSRADRRLVALVTLLCATGVVAMTKVEPPIFEYLVTWRLWFVTLVALASALAVARWAGADRSPNVRSALCVVGAVVLVGVSVTYSIRVAGHGELTPRAHSAVALVRQIAGHAPDGPILLRNANQSFTGIYEGLVDELDRRGIDVRVEHDAFRFGADRVAKANQVKSIWYVTTRPWELRRFLDRPGSRLIGQITPLSSAEEREIAALQADVVDELVQAGRPDLTSSADSPFLKELTAGVDGLDRPAIARLADLNWIVLNSDVCRCAVVSVAPDPTTSAH